MITEYDSLSYFSEWRRISKFKKRKSRKKCWKQKKNEEYEYIYPDFLTVFLGLAKKSLYLHGFGGVLFKNKVI